MRDGEEECEIGLGNLGVENLFLGKELVNSASLD